jgi:hypothetical protein
MAMFEVPDPTKEAGTIAVVHKVSSWGGVLTDHFVGAKYIMGHTTVMGRAKTMGRPKQGDMNWAWCCCVATTIGVRIHIRGVLHIALNGTCTSSRGLVSMTLDQKKIRV